MKYFSLLFFLCLFLGAGCVSSSTQTDEENLDKNHVPPVVQNSETFVDIVLDAERDSATNQVEE
ncbi:MAG: hypothetical protein UU08_C0014G0015 [Candidatus Uhrbacteria bacterium GW2011_GWE2_40_58]|nr:MAG: hypothetical protein UT94_C0013G0021 [Candidatus Uhrbacteria bacterium GW2011_GWF2_40_263]KKR67558.1 MAG: hypothetical protein UU08_C0014G0015 [Candidatus Uhrbacteria bacterium GW2011_GWE2_40_58]OGL93692.1 MAG: hypothetical protein A2239_00150 [Candidatus Uhrbacteria bacterium RIFOXYA2_FULL_40_9]OGL96481.1 MAG: hypothetical protein A2332_04860 [Candidatus Uhrbacteria bacterium RIFOXYB2_FULL_41_18]HBK34580.1 hypothetical protein [Candidatus Uhrbacteria bacterium]